MGAIEELRSKLLNMPAFPTVPKALLEAVVREIDAVVARPHRRTAMQGQKPSVGRIVHYVAYGTPGGEFPAGVCRAAVVTEVGIPLGSTEPDPDQRVGLCVLNPTGQFFNRGIPYAEEKTPGTWHWPEREG